MIANRRKNLIFAVACAILAGLSSLLYLSSAGQPRAAVGRKVVVATRDIPQGEVIGTDMLAVKEVGTPTVARYAIADIAEALNKTASSSIYQGEAVLSSRLNSSDKGSEAAYLVGDGKVAIAVPADPVSAVGNAIRPGDSIDILITTDKSLTGQDETRLLYSDIRVVGVGGTYPFGEAKETGLGGGQPPGGGTIVIEATPEQAKNITYYSEKAKLKLALRSKGAR
ncbi:MAG: Flp pilus assembly protein CpaB [Actinobacteria bacterium]|nr:Flp pilus assembly protein CpaB [Actinomycetota bacterium]